MALLPRTIPLKLGRLDSKTDPRWVLPGDLVSSQNLDFSAWPKLKKRSGFAQLAKADTGSMLATFKSQLLIGTGQEANSYSASGLIDKGVLEGITVSSLAVRRDTYVETSPDSAVHPLGITVYAWETTAGGSQYSVYDSATGQPIVSGVSLGANAVKPKALAIGPYVVILFYDTALNHIRFVAVPALTPTLPTAVADFATDPATSKVFDASVIGGIHGQIFVSYVNTGGSNTLTLKPLTANLVVGAGVTPTTASTGGPACAVFGDDSHNVWAVYADGSVLGLWVYDYSLSTQYLNFTTLDSTAAASTIRNLGGVVSSGVATILYEIPGSQSYNSVVWKVTATLGLNPPVNATFTQGTGTLATATYYYRVVSLTANGHTTPSTETSLAITGPAGVNVNWVRDTNATGYQVYGRSTNNERLLATINSGSTTTWLDDGSIAASGATVPTVNTTVLLSGPSVLLRSVGLASKPFAYKSRIHVLVAYQSTLQSTYFLLSGGTVVAKLAPSLGGGLTAKTILPEMNTVSSGVFSCAYLQTTEIGAQSGRVFSQTGVMGGTFDFTQTQNAVELSDDLHITGGIVSMYDGAAVCEHGFHLYPENVTFSQSTTGGLLSTGSYDYVVTYEWMDAQGLIHQSSPSPALNIVSATNTTSVTLVIPTLRITNKPGTVSIVVWRTQVNQSVFYRLNSISSPLANSTTTDTVNYTDNASDTSIAGNAQLVFNPLNAAAEIAPIAAPAALHAWRYRNRVAIIPAENPFQWVYSKAFEPSTPIEFNQYLLFQSVAQDGGPLTCGIEMDDKNIMFTASKIYYVVGDGPAANGTSSDYGQSPQSVPTDVGCSNRRSLVLTPMGVMFQASNGKGIYLLGRDMSVQYIGAPVEAYNSLTITAAKMDPSNRRVLFFTSSTMALAYDFFSEKWTTWSNVIAADATTFGGLMTYIKPTGEIWQSTPGKFTDNGAPIITAWKTSFISFAGLAGYQRVWRFMLLGDYRSPHSLQVSVSYDGNPAATQVQTISSSTALTVAPVGGYDTADNDSPGDGSFPMLEYLVKLAQQRCSSIQVSFQEIPQGAFGTFGEGLSVSGLSFVVGTLPKTHPVPKGRSI